MHIAHKAELRTRLERTEGAENSVREEMEQLRVELEAERGNGFWRRLFVRRDGRLHT